MFLYTGVTNSMCPHGSALVRGNGYYTCNEIVPCPKEFICHVNAEFGLAVCCPEPGWRRLVLCTVVLIICQKNYFSESFCKLSPDPGPCNKFIPRFAYDLKLNTCEPFQYGGCEGNLNNFNSLESCTEICCNEFKRWPHNGTYEDFYKILHGFLPQSFYSWC